MRESIKARLGSLANSGDAYQQRFLLEAVLADITALRATVALLVADNASRIADHNTLIAKLNLDSGVADTNYAAATAATATEPSALNTIG